MLAEYSLCRASPYAAQVVYFLPYPAISTLFVGASDHPIHADAGLTPRSDSNRPSGSLAQRAAATLPRTPAPYFPNISLSLSAFRLAISKSCEFTNRESIDSV